MKPDRVKRKVHCLSAKLDNTTHNLQDLITQSLNSLRKLSERRELLDDAGKSVRLINYHKTRANALCGVLLTYERGKNQLILAEDDDAEQVSVAQIVPPATKDGKRQEFLDGLLYFICYKNTVLAIQSSQLRIRQLHDHFGWLIRKGCTLSRVRLSLLPSISSASAEKIRKSHAKEITISAPLVSLDKNQPSIQNNSQDVLNTASSTEYRSFNISGLERIRNLLPDSFFLDAKLSDALENNIECKVTIKYKRKITEGGHEFMDTLAIALRGAENVDCSVKLDSGSILNGENLELTGQLDLESNAGVIDPDSAFIVMREWLESQLKAGTIEP